MSDQTDPSKKRWIVKQGRWTWSPMQLSEAMRVAKRQLWGSTEPVVIEPCEVPIKARGKSKPVPEGLR